MLYHCHWIYWNILANMEKVSSETRHARNKLDIYVLLAFSIHSLNPVLVDFVLLDLKFSL